jgi:regulator of protease activity HflC (stomatin/prohibitin superfamily)
MFGLTRIRKYERGLLFRHGDFAGLLGPGKYRLWSRLWSNQRARIEVYNTLDTRFAHELLDVLLADADVASALTVVDLADTQRALLWKNDRLAEILGPGRHAFWRDPYALTVETFDVDAFGLDHPRLEAILSHPGTARWLQGIDVDAHEEVLLYRDGRLVKRLTQGRYVYWKGAGRVNWKAVDLREQLADVAGQEIMTRDKVTLRVNLLVAYRVIDVEQAVTVVADHAQALYRAAQLVLRAAVGTRSLDALLTDKESVGREVAEILAERATEFGVSVRSVGLRDIILPGEMKQILNQVIEAEKQAQANLIRRREETAAARSQANTAKLLAENPALARMKELESLAEILAGTKATFVLGGGDLGAQVRRLTAGDGQPED